MYKSIKKLPKDNIHSLIDMLSFQGFYMYINYLFFIFWAALGLSCSMQDLR